MMCQRIGLPPISTIGFGRNTVSSESRVPLPPASRTAFIAIHLSYQGAYELTRHSPDSGDFEARIDLLNVFGKGNRVHRVHDSIRTSHLVSEQILANGMHHDSRRWLEHQH